MITKTKIVGTLTTLTLTAILLWVSFNQNFILNSSGDMTCAGTPYYNINFKRNISDCQVFWNVTSINYTYYFRNKKGIELGFSPEVKGYDIYVKDGRFKSGWRPLDKSGNFTYRKGIKYQFMAFIFKEINQTVKWKITAAEQTIDPILFGVHIEILKECKIKQEFETIDDYGNITKERDVRETYVANYTYIFINNHTLINETKIAFFNTTRLIRKITTEMEVVGSHIEIINTTICKNYGYNISGHIIDYSEADWECIMDGLKLCCEAAYQSNKNGKCDSGEGYCLFDIKTLSKQCTVSPTKQIRDLNFK